MYLFLVVFVFCCFEKIVCLFRCVLFRIKNLFVHHNKYINLRFIVYILFIFILKNNIVFYFIFLIINNTFFYSKNKKTKQKNKKTKTKNNTNMTISRFKIRQIMKRGGIPCSTSQVSYHSKSWAKIFCYLVFERERERGGGREGRERREGGERKRGEREGGGEIKEGEKSV